MADALGGPSPRTPDAGGAAPRPRRGRQRSWRDGRDPRSARRRRDRRRGRRRGYPGYRRARRNRGRWKPWWTRTLLSGLLAHDLGAEMLMIPTGVPRVAIGFWDTAGEAARPRSPSRRPAATSPTASSARDRWNPKSPRLPTSSPRRRGHRVIGAAEDPGHPGRHLGNADRRRGRACHDGGGRSHRRRRGSAGGQRNIDARLKLAQHGRCRGDVRPRPPPSRSIGSDDQRRSPGDDPDDGRYGCRCGR